MQKKTKEENNIGTETTIEMSWRLLGGMEKSELMNTLEGEEHSERSTVNEESGCIVGGDHHGAHIRSMRQVLSCYVSATTSTRKKKTMKKQARQQQLKRYQRKTWKSEDSLRKEEAHPKKTNNN